MNSKIDILEDLERKRRIYLLGFIVFFGMWQLGTLVTWYFKEVIPNSVFILFGIILLIGTTGWVWISFLLLKIGKVFKQHPEFCKIVNDERNCNLKYKATHYGLIVTMVVSIILYLVFLLGDAWFSLDLSIISGQFVAHLIWVTTLVSSAIAYYNLSKDE